MFQSTGMAIGIAIDVALDAGGIGFAFCELMRNAPAGLWKGDSSHVGFNLH
jgi:hypothetical protein